MKMKATYQKCLNKDSPKMKVYTPKCLYSNVRGLKLIN